MRNQRPKYLELWSKTIGKNHDIFYPLLLHLLDVAAVSSCLFTEWLRPELQELFSKQLGRRTPDLVAWVSGIHDCGKANPVFQGQLASKDRFAPKWETVRSKIENDTPCSFALGEFVRLNMTECELRRHEQMSALFLSDWETDETFTTDQWKEIPSLGHHGTFTLPFSSTSSFLKKTYHKELGELGWIDAQECLNSHLLSALNLSEEDFPEECSPTVSILLSGLTILADRIASNEQWIIETRQMLESGALTFDGDLADWIKTQMSRAPRAINESIGIYKGWSSEDEALEDILKGFEPRGAQEAALRSHSQLLSIMAPTGSGKTEAAFLRHSTHEERLIFLLPTMATTNALMKRTQKVFWRESNVAALSHSSATLEDFYNNSVSVFDDDHSAEDSGGLFPTSFVKKGLERMLASVAIATVDQALKSALPIKWIHLLLLALANAHIVVDEVHTMDPYQAELLKKVLYWLGKTHARVTLLTATFPTTTLHELSQAYAAGEGTQFTPCEVSFPSLVDGLGREVALPSRTYKVGFQMERADNRAIAERHVNWALDQRKKFPNSRIGVICNQVRRCQEIAEALIQNGENVVVLHSALTASHRSKITATLETLLGPGGAGRNVTVVGTQAIEASLDIDLDLMSVDLCPSTSLLQRAGRLWRRDDPERSTRVPGLNMQSLHIVLPHDYKHGDYYPYQPAVLSRTHDWLENHPQPIEIPADCQQFVDACTLSIDEIDQSSEERYRQDLEYLSDSTYRKQTARNRLVDFTKILNPDRELSILGLLTGTSNSENTSFDELMTRLIDIPTVRVITVDANGFAPGALSPDYLDNLDLNNPDKKTVQRILQGSLNINEQIAKLCSDRLSDFIESKSVLSKYCRLDVTGIYDPITGLNAQGLTQNG